MDLVYEFKYHADLKPGVMGAGPHGARIFFEVTGGTVEGERLKGKVLTGGGDWLLVGSDKWGRPDIRTQFQTDSGAIIFVRYHGLLEMNEKVGKAADGKSGTDFGDQYFRTTPVFETGDKAYAWLTQSLFVAEGRLTAGPGVDYNVYRVT